MATFFSLQDGNLSNSSIYGYSLSSAEVMSNTTGVWLSTVDAYGPTFTGDGSSISAVAVHLSARSADPNNSVLTLKLSSASSVRTETYPVSSFTSYNGSYNLLTNHPQNWQILKLSSPYTLPRLSACKISLATSSLSTLSLMCGASNNYNKAIISSNVSAVSANLVPLDTNTTGMAFVSGITLTKSGTISGSTDSPFTDTTGLSASYYSNGGSLTIPYATNTWNLTSTSWTIELFIKPYSNGSNNSILGCYASGQATWRWYSYINANGSINITQTDSTYTTYTGTTKSGIINLSAWNHIVYCSLNGTVSIYINGLLQPYASTAYNGAPQYYYFTVVSSTPITIGSGLIGNITGLRVINGYCLYTGTKINVPTTRPLPLPNTQAYIIEPNSGKYYFNTNVTDTVNLHLGSSLLSSGIQSRNITVNSDILVDNLFVHNNANVSFNTSSSPVLMVKGLSGIQITSDGTLNVGTSSSQVLSSSTHTILLSNTQIDVHNGGNLNTYGYVKPVTTNLISDIGSSVRTFSATDSISGSWGVGDTLLFKPNLSSIRTSFDVLTLSSFVASNIFTTTANSTYSHTGSATYGYVPAIYNLNRNVKINGYDGINRGTIRVIDAAKTNINYTELNNFGISGTNNKNGLILANNSSGSTTLSSSVINSDNISNIAGIVPLTGRVFQNFNIYNNIIKSNSLTLSSLSVNNINISNNYILSSSKIGLQMNNLSGSINMSNNTTVGSLSYGAYLYNNPLTGSYGALSYNSGLQGTMVSGTNTGIIIGGGINSSKEGVYADAATNNLSGITFQDILASNNSSAGFKVSGNSLTYTNPVVLNINGLSANSNNDAGIEAYNITGNLSSLILNTNLVGNKISIGNGPTIFDGLSSTLNGNCLTILSATNYNQTIIKNAFLSSLSATGTALNINVDKLEEFRLEGSTLSANTPFKITTTRSKLEGSYMFHNSNSNVYGLSSLALTGYQSDVFKESGLVVMRENGLSSNHYKYLAAGSITLDKTVVNLPNTISEKLTPWSATTKLRSTSKFIPVNIGSIIYISVLVKRSTGYTGSAPRLVAVSNPSVGISGGVLYTSIQTSGWELMSATLPATTNAGFVEFYIDCSGNVGSGYINIDSWDFNY